MVLAIVRGKAVAMLLGPAGIGFWGMYQGLADVTRSLAGLGINSSGVRQIAEAVGTGDSKRVAHTVTTLRRVAFYSGALGALLLLVFSKPIARYSFGDDQHTWAVAWLALAVFFADVSAGQGALIQGMRRIADLARINVLSAIYGTVFSILIVYWRGAAGLAPSLVCVAGMSILTSWWYARKIKVEPVQVTARDMVEEAGSLIKLGVVFMASALLPMAATQLIRVIIIRKLGGESAGYYQAAWALGGYYIGFILQAMGADFFPRLTAVAKDNRECNRLVNEQTEVGLLMACPGILAALAFAPPVMTLFYSKQFGESAEIFRWICLGMLMRVLVWPMGFIIVAKGERKLFLWTELLSNGGFVAFAWLGLVCVSLYHHLPDYSPVKRIQVVRRELTIGLGICPTCGRGVYSPIYSFPHNGCGCGGGGDHTSRDLFRENALHVGSVRTAAQARAEADDCIPLETGRYECLTKPTI